MYRRPHACVKESPFLDKTYLHKMYAMGSNQSINEEKRRIEDHMLRNHEAKEKRKCYLCYQTFEMQ